MKDLMDVVLSGIHVKGKRPYFFKDPDVERVLNITMAVAGELAVARERIDTLERLLEAKGVLERDDVESYRPDEEVAAERMRWDQEYIARVLRIVQQDIAELEKEETEKKSA